MFLLVVSEAAVIFGIWRVQGFFEHLLVAIAITLPFLPVNALSKGKKAP